MHLPGVSILKRVGTLPFPPPGVLPEARRWVALTQLGSCSGLGFSRNTSAAGRDVATARGNCKISKSRPLPRGFHFLIVGGAFQGRKEHRAEKLHECVALHVAAQPEALQSAGLSAKEILCRVPSWPSLVGCLKGQQKSQHAF